MLTLPRWSPLGSALSARQVALWAGLLFQPREPVPESVPPPALLLVLEPHVQRRSSPRWRVGWDLGRGARHGPAGRDARVPGGAETAAERAADPGVRPGVGVWAPRHGAYLASGLPGASPPPWGGRIFEFFFPVA